MDWRLVHECVCKERVGEEVWVLSVMVSSSVCGQGKKITGDY